MGETKKEREGRGVAEADGAEGEEGGGSYGSKMRT